MIFSSRQIVIDVSMAELINHNSQSFKILDELTAGCKLNKELSLLYDGKTRSSYYEGYTFNKTIMLYY